MGGPQLILNGKGFTYHQITRKLFEPATPFEHATLGFCHAWLAGKEHFVFHTSGSTGPAKDIVFARNQLVASARMTQKALGLVEGDTSLVCLDTKFVAGQMMLVRGFVAGLNLVAVEPSANPFAKLDPHLKIDFIALVPYQLQAILKEGPRALDKVRVAIIGGAPVDLHLKTKLNAVKCEAYATYGMTETLSHIGLMRLNGPAPEDCYTALPGVKLEKDERGCLVIRTGYLEGPVVTNDLVKIGSPRQFRWLGRWDNIINTGGVKVVPEEIERQVEEIFVGNGITSRFFVTGLPDPVLGQKVCLIIESPPFAAGTLRQLQLGMKAALSKFEAPKETIFLDNFVETGSGKVNRPKTIHLLPT